MILKIYIFYRIHQLFWGFLIVYIFKKCIYEKYNKNLLKSYRNRPISIKIYNKI